MKNNYYRLSIFIILAFLSGLLLFRTPIIQVVSTVIHRQGSSHGVFVPFISLYFLWLKKDDLKEIKFQYNNFGIILLLFGVIFSLLRTGFYQLQFLGFIIFLTGLIYSVFGKECLKQVSFPVLFLITMIPIPKDIYFPVANYCRHIAAAGSLKIISLLGISYFKNGWLIQLPNALLNIHIGCSGIRYLISYFVFGLAYAYLSRNTIRGRLLIVMLTIPISHFASICRLAAIFIMTYIFGPHMAEHWPHIIISWMVFFVILMSAIALDQYIIKRIYTRKLGGEKAGKVGDLQAGRL